MDEHPGGRHLLKAKVGKDATTAFLGGVYDHSNAAHNLLSMMRVGVLDGGYQWAINEIEKQEARAQAIRDASAKAGTIAGAKALAKDTPTSNLGLNGQQSTSEGQDSDEIKMVHPQSVSYVVPGKAYVIQKNAELKANVRDVGGKVGKW